MKNTGLSIWNVWPSGRPLIQPPDFVIIFDSKYKKSCSGVLFPRSPFLSTHHKLISKQEIRFITSPKMRAKISEILIFSFFFDFLSILSDVFKKNEKICVFFIFFRRYFFRPRTKSVSPFAIGRNTELLHYQMQRKQLFLSE